MKLQTIRRGTAAAAVLTLSLTLAACGEEDEPSSSGNDTSSSAAPEESAPAPEESETPTEDAAMAAPFGPACGDLPQGTEPGSLDAMVSDPVGTAASTNPLLTTLVAAASAVPGLVDTLNDESATYTVFAPANPAFEKIDPAALQGLIDGAAKADSPLATVLTHHVLAERIEPDAITAGEMMPLAGDPITVTGDPAGDPDNVVVSDGVAEAKVLCGGIQTANATVYVIDTVLTQPLG